jgi:hypothetical protein
MEFAQLYYTSCERGLSGFAGFQFNAVTPGLEPRVLREVEALASYEPPRRVGSRPSAADIAGCPVSLVYSGAPTGVLARVIFVGLDFSQRTGNYFAHALVGGAGPDEFGSMLPIEFWDSPVWAAEPVGVTELPALSAVPPPDPGGPLDRAGLDRFLRHASREQYVPGLLTAADNAVLEGGRPIVIVAPDTMAAARWIAAMSFLLSPAAARRLSFSTYHHRPGYLDVHMIGTVPDSDFEANDLAFRSYVLLDLTAGRMTDVTAHPAAVLLTRAGVGRAAALWAHAGRLAEGDGLAQAYPALVAAAMLEGAEVTAADLDALAGWLPTRAGRLDPARRGDLVRRFLDDPACRAEHWRAVSAVARLQPDVRLTASIEELAVTRELGLIAEAGPDYVSTGVPVTTGRSREFAAHQCARYLNGASVALTMALLDWRSELGIQLPGAALRGCGEHVLGPELIRAPGADTVDALAGDRLLLEGAVAHLASVAGRQPGAIQAVMAAGLADLIKQAAVELPPELRRAALLAEGRLHPERRLQVLSQLLAPSPGPANAEPAHADQREADQREAGSPGTGPADAGPAEPEPMPDDLLAAMWPAGHWTAAEAAEVVGAVGPGPMIAEPLLSWLARAIVDPPRPDDYLTGYEELCRLAAGGPLDERLPADACGRLASFADAVRLLAQAAESAEDARTELAGRLADGYAIQPAPTQDLLRPALASQLDELAGSPFLAALAARYPGDVVAAYLTGARGRLAAVPRDTPAAARLFRCLRTLRDAGDTAVAPGLEPVLRDGLESWSPAELSQLHEHLRRADESAAAVFDGWRQQHPADLLKQGLHRFLGSRSWRRP